MIEETSPIDEKSNSGGWEFQSISEEWNQNTGNSLNMSGMYSPISYEKAQMLNKSLSNQTFGKHQLICFDSIPEKDEEDIETFRVDEKSNEGSNNKDNDNIEDLIKAYKDSSLS